VGKWNIAIQTSLIAAGVIAIKLAIHYWDLEIFALNALFTSVIAGSIFLISMILAGTMSDFKESERVPSEMVAALEGIYDEGVRTYAQSPCFSLDALRARLIAIVETFHTDLADADHQARRCLQAIGALGDSFAEMEACGMPPNYVVRLKTEQATLRKLVLRVYHMQRTGFLPSAYVLVDGIIVLTIGLLLLAEIDHVITGLIQIGVISYLFVYMVKLLRAIDQPFRVTEQTQDDVSRFLLKEFVTRVKAEAHAVPVEV
jgi:hypothetical protein